MIMKKYIVEILVSFQTVKKYVTDSIDIAEMIADNYSDDYHDVVIREVVL